MASGGRVITARESLHRPRGGGQAAAGNTFEWPGSQCRTRDFSQPLPAQTMVTASLGLEPARGLDLELGVGNATGLSLAEKSPLFVWAEPPRTWRLSLRARW